MKLKNIYIAEDIMDPSKLTGHVTLTVGERKDIMIDIPEELCRPMWEAAKKASIESLQTGLETLKQEGGVK